MPFLKCQLLTSILPSAQVIQVSPSPSTVICSTQQTSLLAEINGTQVSDPDPNPASLHAHWTWALLTSSSVWTRASNGTCLIMTAASQSFSHALPLPQWSLDLKCACSEQKLNYLGYKMAVYYLCVTVCVLMACGLWYMSHFSMW